MFPIISVNVSDIVVEKLISSRKIWSIYIRVCFAKLLRSIPWLWMLSIFSKMVLASAVLMVVKKSLINVSEATPKNLVICSSSMFPRTLTWSIYLMASRTHHSAIFAMSSNASSLAVRFSCSVIRLRCFLISPFSTFL